jgi:hypothetical protein
MVRLSLLLNGGGGGGREGVDFKRLIFSQSDCLNLNETNVKIAKWLDQLQNILRTTLPRERPSFTRVKISPILLGNN